MKEKRIKRTFYISTILIALMLFVFSYMKTESETVLLNEVCTHNNGVIYNRFGDYYDYVEIYNPCDSDVDLAGFTISDDENNLSKFFLDGNVVPAKGYVLIFLDSEETGFGLSDNETVYLSDDKGNVIDKVKIPVMEENLSYCYNKNNNSWNICVATPLKENDFESKIKYKDLNITINASVESGFYDNPFYLELSSDSNCKIYYTLDATEPTSQSNVYEGPIYIYDRSNEEDMYASIETISSHDWPSMHRTTEKVEKATVLRAICIDEEGNRCNELVETYFICFSDKEGYNELPTISLITNPENLFDYEKGIYVTGLLYDRFRYYEEYNKNEHTMPANYRKEGSGWSKSAIIQSFDLDGELKTEDSIDLSIHGNISRSYPQKSFNIIKIPSIGESIFDTFITGSESLMLRNGGGADCYTTQIRDAVNQKLMNNSEIRIQNCKLFQVFIDGEYWGAYNLQERVDKAFIKNYFDVDEDIYLIKVDTLLEQTQDGSEYSPEYKEIGDDTGGIEELTSLFEYIANNNMSSKVNYEYVKSVFEIDHYIDYWLFQIYIGNVDVSGCKNISYWKTVNKNSKWDMIIYDTELSTNIGDTSMYYNANIFNDILSKDEVFVSLMKNKEFRNKFVNRYRELADSIFDYTYFNTILDNYLNGAYKSMQMSKDRFYAGFDSYENLIEGYKSFFKNRREYADAIIEQIMEETK